MLCLTPMVAVAAVLTLYPNRHHVTDLDGGQVVAQSCVTGPGLYVTVMGAGLYTGGVQYGYPVRLSRQVTLIGQGYVGASYVSRWMPELPNAVQFDAGLRVLLRVQRTVLQVAWQHESHAGLGRSVVREGRLYRNTGLDLLTVGVGWEF